MSLPRKVVSPMGLVDGRLVVAAQWLREAGAGTGSGSGTGPSCGSPTGRATRTTSCPSAGNPIGDDRAHAAYSSVTGGSSSSIDAE